MGWRSLDRREDEEKSLAPYPGLTVLSQGVLEMWELAVTRYHSMDFALFADRGSDKVVFSWICNTSKKKTEDLVDL